MVIEVSNLSKKYIIGHQRQGSYQTLRDTLAHTGRSLWQRLRHPLSVNRETVELEEFWALKDVNFQVQQGDCLGIIGRNGAGKSTLLKILSRITEPTTGRIHIKGRIASLLEVGTGFHPELTGRENIFLNGAILGMTRQEIKRKFDEIVAFAEVEKFLDTPVKRYSSGMYVRLGFAVAAHLDPEILIVDEVLAVGDIAFQKKCLGKMGDVAGGGRTVLFVSHNMSAINQLCPKCILLEDGRIVRQGESTEVTSYYLAGGETGESILEVPGDNDKPIQIRVVGIRDHKWELASTVDLNKEFVIQIDYEVREDISNVSVGCQIISDENNQCIISLSDWELEESRLDNREPGYYKSSVVIPAKILNTGAYHLRVGVSKRSQIYDVVDGISFTVADHAGIVQKMGFERKNALLSMQLEWKAAREEPEPHYLS